MVIEKMGDLFKKVEAKKDRKDWYYVHCISRDASCGAGIAVEMDKRFKVKQALTEMAAQNRKANPSNYRYWGSPRPEEFLEVGTATLTGRVFNLVTKDFYFHKPTYETMRAALVDLNQQLVANGITKIAMPKIGCGLDKLNWNKVSAMIEEIIDDDIRIEVYIL